MVVQTLLHSSFLIVHDTKCATLQTSSRVTLMSRMACTIAKHEKKSGFSRSSTAFQVLVLECHIRNYKRANVDLILLVVNNAIPPCFNINKLLNKLFKNKAL